MRKVVIALACLLVAGMAGSGWAKENSLKDGMKALQFSIDHNFTLSSFQGSTISIKKHTRDDAAWRLGVSLSLLGRDRDYIDRRNDTPRSTTDDNRNSAYVDLRLYRVKYPAPNAAVNFFWGIGPQLQYSRVSDDNVVTYESPNRVMRNESTLTGYGIGAGGIVGVEVFVAKGISLLAEYGQSFSYSYSKTKIEEIRTDADPVFRSTQYRETKENRWSFMSDGVTLGLSVYF
jgi:hypothetical protein